MDRKEKQLRYFEAGLLAEKMLATIDCESSRHVNIGRLLKAGFNVLSSGAYGTTILSQDEQWVLKVCWDKQDAYPIYARWAVANPGPHIPEIFYQVQTEQLYLCAMPRYYETHESCYDHLSHCRDLARYHAPLDTDPSLAVALRNMLDALEDFCAVDMHFGNFMYDNKRMQYVVTDPFSSLYLDPQKAAARATGTEYKEPIKDQLDIFEQAAVEVPTPVDLSYLEEQLVEVVQARFVGRGANPQQVPKSAARKLLHVPDFAALEVRLHDNFERFKQQPVGRALLFGKSIKFGTKGILL